MKFKLVTLIGATALLSACAHHPAPPPPSGCSDHIKPGDVPPAPPGHHWGKDTPPPPRPCHAPHAANNERVYGVFGTEPYKATRAAPNATRLQTAPETVERDNYPFWR